MLNRLPAAASALTTASLPLPHILAAIGGFNGSGRRHVRSDLPRGGIVIRNSGTQTQSQSPRLEDDAQEGFRPNLRVALYSHDTMGLGHLRRNLVIASALGDSRLNATSLLITGAHEANFFSLPPRADFLTLPRLHKTPAGVYSAGKLDISVDDLISLRARSICSAIESFRPDLLVVDKVPLGAFGELVPTLKYLRRRGNIRCVLGIRDVLDDPDAVRAETDNLVIREAIEKYYDQIWVYGDRRVYDPIVEYQWPVSVESKVKFTGYLDQSYRLTKGEVEDATRRGTGSDRLVVCTLGGGQDGFCVAKTFVEALPSAGVEGVLLTGPFMPKAEAAHIESIAHNRANLRVQEFSAEADYLISRADCVVTMGGYNSVCSVLSFGKRALIVPRVAPRREQLIRAERLARLGLVDVMHPDHLSAAAMRDWITRETGTPRSPASLIDMQGLNRLEQFCSCLMSNAPSERAIHKGQ